MNVAFRVDASPQIGTGHFMRCLALAEGVRQNGAGVRFVARHLPPHFRAMLAERGCDAAALGAPCPGGESADTPHAAWLGTSQAADAHETALALDGRHWDWLVVDHYALDARWETPLRAHARRILVIDDLADRAHDCDVLVDQNLYADMDTRYAGKVPAACELQLGPRYALLRREFREARTAAAPRTGPVRRVLVAFGGIDAENRTTLAVEAVAASHLSQADVDVVTGAGHAHRDAVAAACARYGFRHHRQTTRMAALMASADLSIGAGGITVWERCSVGLPALAMPVAANQDRMVAEAGRRGLLWIVGADDSAATLAARLDAAAADGPAREAMSRHGFEAVDGRGVERVARAIDPGIEIREATREDARAIFAWRNDETVRRASRRADAIDWAGHEAWFTGVLADPDRVLLVGEERGAAVGVVRFDICGARAEVSIYRVPDRGAEGVGSRLLRAAERWLQEQRPDVACVDAEVLDTNERSHGLFSGNGYRRHGAGYEKALHR